MNALIKAILDFLSKTTTLAITGSILALLAGEVRLAALKKASQGSTKISKYTERMTGIKLDL